ncbi:MAG TPA: NosD domain-containing protein [Flavobacteriales bacterium]|nr:NosD domain-containing protein [Flavobacteriales bacterium]
MASQGLLEFINGGRVENAEIGVLLGSRDQPGISGGGVVRAYGTNNEPIPITNCITGIQFDPYGPSNASILRHIEFTRNEEALPGLAGGYLKDHILAREVKDLVVEACQFSNDQPGLTTAIQQGDGIHTASSSIVVRSRCANGGASCGNAALVPSRFTQLNNGVYMEAPAEEAAEGSVLLVEFENNRTNVFARDNIDLFVGGCQFSSTLTDPVTGIPNATGIRSTLSRLEVRPRCPDGTTNCADPLRVPNRFQGLAIGIRLDNAGTAVSTATVVRAEFENNSTAVRADKMTSVDIRACSFSNTQPGITTSTALGQGITSINSTLTVRPGCPNGADECPGQTLVRNTFSNLDHGIELFDTGFGSYATIFQNDFTNNIAGIYANGMTGFAVTENLFTVGDNAVVMDNPVEVLWEDMHRAVFSTISYGFVIRDNTLMQASTGVAQPMSGTEGIVVGYTRDFNDVVYRNQATGLERAYIGEGVCADVFPPNNAKLIGLQFQCNTNTDNKVNIWSRLIESAPVLEQPQHTIRGYQGHRQKADNRFDRWDPTDPTLMDFWDYNVSTTFTPIIYSHRDPVSPASIGFVPWSVPNDPLRFQAIPFDDDFGGCGVLLSLIPYDPGDNGAGMAEDQEEYGTLKYLYDQLMDGGSTDEVVQEIVSSWPSEAWQLRQYLLDLSPFLSMESLKQAVNKPNFPMAMKAEVCIANPDATQKEGFIKWLELGANEPMPAYLIAMIEASWETKTFRTDMEMELADLHTAICQRATEMLFMEHQKPAPSPAQKRMIWQQVRTTAARYAEANVLLAQGDHTAARTVIQNMPVDKALKAPEVVEQQRMLSYITILEAAANGGRSATELTMAEVNQLKALIVEQYDRPANWISNLLCLYYGECRAPLTGGEVGGQKSLRPTVMNEEEVSKNVIVIAPNPAQSWATVTYTLQEVPVEGWIRVKDLFGRVVIAERMAGDQGQVVLDTRMLSKGVYLVECTTDSVLLLSERLIVQ